MHDWYLPLVCALCPKLFPTPATQLSTLTEQTAAVHELLSRDKGPSHAAGSLQCVPRDKARNLQSPCLHFIPGKPAYQSLHSLTLKHGH